MKIYLISLCAGVLAGVLYALLGVRSPAPPIVALVGLLGILIGEQVPSLVKQRMGGGKVSAAEAEPALPAADQHLPNTDLKP